MNLLDILRLTSPIITGFMTNLIFKIDRDTANKVKARPPSWAFGVVWSLLYILVGISWYRIKNNQLSNILYISLLFLLCLWIAVYKYNKRYALYIIALCGLNTILLIISNYSTDPISSMLLAPLLVWLNFAQSLNYSVVNE